MQTKKLYKTLSVALCFVLCAVCLLPALQTGVSAAACTQGFENSFDNCGAGFSVYEGSEGDSLVRSGTHSLKWNCTTTKTWCTGLFQSGQSLEAGKDYVITLWVYITAKASERFTLQVQTVSARTNGWSFNGAERSQEIGFGSDKANTWQQVRINLKATYAFLGLSVYGTCDAYIDDITVENAPNPITVSFNTNGGSAVSAITGVPGNALTLPAAPVKEGHYFVGWYTDAACTVPFTATVFPAAATTLYAKWNKAGSVKQDFEAYDLKLESGTGFSIYTGTAGDPNVTGGTHSLFKDGSVTKSTRVITLSGPYGQLTVGKGYRFSAKIKVTAIGDGTALALTQISHRTNPWTYGTAEDLNRHYVLSVGQDYQHLNEFYEIEYYFVATQKYFGLGSWGGTSYYLDDVEVTEVPMVQVSFDTPGVTPPATVEGPAGMKLSVANPTPPEGKSFAGWYAEPTYKNVVNIKAFPQTNTTYYAKWIDEGCFEQSFEQWYSGNGLYMSQDAFTHYEAKDENDPNVYDGKYSIKYDSTGGHTKAITLFDQTMGKLTVGEKYYVTVHFKLERTPDDKWGSNGSYHSIYYTTHATNPWTYTGQGPLGRYLPYAFYENDIGDYWNGTSVTSTTKKDANGWLTMTYEITATTNYIAMFFSGDFALYMDAISITPLPNGLIERNYENSYCEDFYNVLRKVDFSNSAAGKKTVYPIEVGSRADLVFAAEPKNGAKAWLAYDAAGANKIEGTDFETSGVHFASRIMTDFGGMVYLVVEGNAKTDFNYLALYPRQFGLNEAPSDQLIPSADYEHLTAKNAATDSPTADERLDGDNSGEQSPATGDAGWPLFAIVLSTAAAATAVILKRGRKA